MGLESATPASGGWLSDSFDPFAVSAVAEQGPFFPPPIYAAPQFLASTLLASARFPPPPNTSYGQSLADNASFDMPSAIPSYFDEYYANSDCCSDLYYGVAEDNGLIPTSLSARPLFHSTSSSCMAQEENASRPATPTCLITDSESISGESHGVSHSQTPGQVTSLTASTAALEIPATNIRFAFNPHASAFVPGGSDTLSACNSNDISSSLTSHQLNGSADEFEPSCAENVSGSNGYYQALLHKTHLKQPLNSHVSSGPPAFFAHSQDSFNGTFSEPSPALYRSSQKYVYSTTSPPVQDSFFVSQTRFTSPDTAAIASPFPLVFAAPCSHLPWFSLNQTVDDKWEHKMRADDTTNAFMDDLRPLSPEEARLQYYTQVHLGWPYEDVEECNFEADAIEGFSKSEPTLLSGFDFRDGVSNEDSTLVSSSSRLCQLEGLEKCKAQSQSAPSLKSLVEMLAYSSSSVKISPEESTLARKASESEVSVISDAASPDMGTKVCSSKVVEQQKVSEVSFHSSELAVIGKKLSDISQFSKGTEDAIGSEEVFIAGQAATTGLLEDVHCDDICQVVKFERGNRPAVAWYTGDHGEWGPIAAAQRANTFQPAEQQCCYSDPSAAFICPMSLTTSELCCSSVYVEARGESVLPVEGRQWTNALQPQEFGSYTEPSAASICPMSFSSTSDSNCRSVYAGVSGEWVVPIVGRQRTNDFQATEQQCTYTEPSTTFICPMSLTSSGFSNRSGYGGASGESVLPVLGTNGTSNFQSAAKQCCYSEPSAAPKHPYTQPLLYSSASTRKQDVTDMENALQGLACIFPKVFTASPELQSTNISPISGDGVFEGSSGQHISLTEADLVPIKTCTPNACDSVSQLLNHKAATGFCANCSQAGCTCVIQNSCTRSSPLLEVGEGSQGHVPLEFTGAPNMPVNAQAKFAQENFSTDGSRSDTALTGTGTYALTASIANLAKVLLDMKLRRSSLASSTEQMEALEACMQNSILQLTECLVLDQCTLLKPVSCLDLGSSTHNASVVHQGESSTKPVSKLKPCESRPSDTEEFDVGKHAVDKVKLNSSSHGGCEAEFVTSHLRRPMSGEVSPEMQGGASRAVFIPDTNSGEKPLNFVVNPQVASADKLAGCSTNRHELPSHLDIILKECASKIQHAVKEEKKLKDMVAKLKEQLELEREEQRGVVRLYEYMVRVGGSAILQSVPKKKSLNHTPTFPAEVTDGQEKIVPPASGSICCKSLSTSNCSNSLTESKNLDEGAVVKIPPAVRTVISSKNENPLSNSKKEVHDGSGSHTAVTPDTHNEDLGEADLLTSRLTLLRARPGWNDELGAEFEGTTDDREDTGLLGTRLGGTCEVSHNKNTGKYQHHQHLLGSLFKLPTHEPLQWDNLWHAPLTARGPQMADCGFESESEESVNSSDYWKSFFSSDGFATQLSEEDIHIHGASDDARSRTLNEAQETGQVGQDESLVSEPFFNTYPLILEDEISANGQDAEETDWEKIGFPYKEDVSTLKH